MQLSFFHLRDTNDVRLVERRRFSETTDERLSFIQNGDFAAEDRQHDVVV